MPDNFGGGPNQAADNQNSGAFSNAAFSGARPTPITSRPPATAKAEDIFANVDKSGPIIVRPPLNASPPSQPTTPPPTLKVAPYPSDRPTPAEQQIITPPQTAAGSTKYLFIGLVTLVLILLALWAIYIFILKPQWDNVVAPSVNNPTTPPSGESTESATPSVGVDATATEAIGTSTPEVGVGGEETAAVATSSATGSLDSDGDRLTDAEEAGLGTNSNSADTDGDDLNDYEEAKVYHTDPLRADTDGDSYPDGVEVKNGYDPNGPGRLLIVNQ